MIAMKVLKTILLITITMAFSITLAMKTISKIEEAQVSPNINSINNNNLFPLIKPSRFLAEKKKEKTRKNPARAVDHCKKNRDRCELVDYFGDSFNATCCKDKCVDLQYDENNCGACKKRCDFTEACCRGQCVYLAFDKRHCGECNDRCSDGLFCIFGMCDYA